MYVNYQECDGEICVFQWSSYTFPLFIMSVTNNKKFGGGAQLIITAQNFVMSHGHQFDAVASSVHRPMKYRYRAENRRDINYFFFRIYAIVGIFIYS
jgi:hypothetical protein